MDNIIQGAAILVLGFGLFAVLLLSGQHASERLTGKWFIAGSILIFFLIFWGYFSLFEAFWHGQTPGKRAMKLRVIKDSGRQITLFESLTRNLLRVVDYLPSLYLTGVITMLANKRNKRLGDLAAGTLVIHERSDDQPLLWTGAQRDYMPANWQPAPLADDLFPSDRVMKLHRADLQVAESFFARAMELAPDVRETMATRILRQLCERMGTPVPDGNPERALERLTVQMRALGRRLPA